MQDLAAALAAPEARAARYELHLLRAWDAAAELARQVEREVFAEFFGNTPELLAREYGRFEDASVFLLVLDHERAEPAGVCRIVKPSPSGNKTVEDLERVWGLPVGRHGQRWDDAWDVATLAVQRRYRGRRTNGLVSAALFQGVTMLMSRRDVRWVTATLDLVVLDLVQRQCGEPFVPFPGAEPRSYLDSPLSLPVYCDGDRFRARLAAEDPSRYAFFFEGVGLEGLVSTPFAARNRLHPLTHLRGPTPDRAVTVGACTAHPPRRHSGQSAR
jgi:hypothetical protein